ncbi:MAG: formyltetrahydrofolate deformylase [Candidatus Omnitrophica bacterium]|nr:formyltetrahydrofolate deformylase [Candidatus Omnitrophota bacterium]
MPKAVLLISCPDHRGITAAITHFIYQHNGNILHADQHTDDQTNTFFMRVEWDLTGFDIPRDDIKQIFAPIAQNFHMEWSLNFSDQKSRMAIFVSRQLHCLFDLLYRRQAGHFDCDIPLIVSNHQDAEPLAKQFGIRFCHFPVFAENKTEQEHRQLEILTQEKIDTIVLARYHQILSPQFVQSYHNRIINIHHSFLPAFVGQKPYEQAFRKGVKIIGATSHYVTADLDQGPIIEQDTVRISHRDELEDLIRKGEDLEKMVLSRAVRWHLQKKILGYGNKTVIFD